VPYQSKESRRSSGRGAMKWLLDRGWWESPEGWRHPRLEFPWPMELACRLQAEVDQDMMDPIHRTMREEVWPT